MLQRLHHGVNPSRGRKEEEAHWAWLHTAAHGGGTKLAVASRRSGGGKSLSSQRGVRHTSGAWGGIGRAGGGLQRPNHRELSRRLDGVERSVASGFLTKDDAMVHC
jgi:hypothetical protein